MLVLATAAVALVAIAFYKLRPEPPARPKAALVIEAAGAAAGAAAVPPGYPGSYEQIVAAARREGALSIYSATDAREVADLLRDFGSLYPEIRVEYADLNSTELYSRFIAEVAAREGSADFLWSSAMDLQFKLVNDGYAQVYASPEKPNLPAWAVWEDKAYGVTAEPIVFAYNKRLMPEADVPRTHADLTRLLKAKPDAYQGKIGSYNPERSGVGFLYITQDTRVNPDIFDFVRALGRTHPKFYTSTGAMMERVISGEHLLAYNMIGSYALDRQTRDPSLGVIMPSDYTLVMSRVALIPTDARHPNAAKVLLDYMLSARGQALLAERHMSPVRADVAPPPGSRPTEEAARAIGVGPTLLANLDQIKRLRFLKDWRRALKGD
jgi:iron(III) transport system substrate-binding protein